MNMALASQNEQSVVSESRTAGHLWIIWDDAMWQETLEVKIRARKYKGCLVISKEKPRRLFIRSVSHDCCMFYLVVPLDWEIAYIAKQI